MPKAKLGDVEIYYESHGEVEPLLLVPGLGGVGSYCSRHRRWLCARRTTN